jgi:hypothetical protein
MFGKGTAGKDRKISSEVVRNTFLGCVRLAGDALVLAFQRSIAWVRAHLVLRLLGG